jgi:hypothetical protein
MELEIGHNTASKISQWLLSQAKFHSENQSNLAFGKHCN